MLAVEFDFRLRANYSIKQGVPDFPGTVYRLLYSNMHRLARTACAYAGVR